MLPKSFIPVYLFIDDAAKSPTCEIKLTITPIIITTTVNNTIKSHVCQSL